MTVLQLYRLCDVNELKMMRGEVLVDNIKKDPNIFLHKFPIRVTKPEPPEYELLTTLPQSSIVPL